MAEKFRFFDAQLDANNLPDREYNAQEFTDYFKALVTTGLMKGAGNQLEVTSDGSTMVTTIDTGIAFLLGRYYENDSLLPHTHETETVGLDRIDRVVIRLDGNTDARYVKSFVKKGVASASPVAPALTQTASVYEISLAQVKVVGGKTFIEASDITDERGKDVICPYAGSNILPNFDASGLAELVGKVDGHATNTSNPHNVTSGQVNMLPNYSKKISDHIDTYPIGISVVHVQNENGGGWGNFGTVVTIKGYAGGGGSLQAYTPYSEPLGGSHVKLRKWQYKATDWDAFEINVTSKLPVWISATLAGGWSHAAAPREPLRYYKDSFGVVRVSGTVDSVTGRGGFVITTLPVGYRPDKLIAVLGATANENLLELHTDGKVQCNSAPGDYVFIRIAFRTV